MNRLATVLVSAAFASAAVSTPVDALELKIATVDLQRALNESSSGKAAKEEFKAEVDKLQGDLAKQKDGLEKLKADVEKKAMVLRDDERRNLERDYQKRLRDFQRTYQDSQQELQARDKEYTALILQDLQEVIVDFGANSDYTLILEASNTGTVLYGARTIDITDRIIEEYDGRAKKKRR